MLNDATRPALTSGKLVHLVTLNPDGSPRVSLVYVGLDGDTIVSGHLGEYRKIKNVPRDPRISLSIGTGDGIPGFDNYLVVEASACMPGSTCS